MSSRWWRRGLALGGFTAIRRQPCRAGHALSRIVALVGPGLTRRIVAFFAHGKIWGLAFSSLVRRRYKASGNRTANFACRSFRRRY